MKFQDYFKDKKVTVMGLGLLGRGVGDAAYIAEAGAAEVIVTDLKTEDQLQESVDRLRQYDNITFVLGEHRLEDFTDRDLVLVAAGVPVDSAYLAYARQAGVRLAQSAALFADLSGIPVIGVTGTRGKSKEFVEEHYPVSYRRMKKLDERHHHLVLPMVFLYATIIPFPNEAILIPLALLGFRFRILLLPLILGNLVNQTALALGATNIFTLLFGL